MTGVFPILAADGMRAAEAAAIDAWGIPARLLMETAGRAASDVVVDVLGGSAEGRRVAVLAGPGNNGGDGFVAARALHARGADVRVVSVEPGKGEGADRKVNRILVERLASDRLRVETSPADLSPDRPPDVVVDALLGTGAGGALRPGIARLAEWIDAQRCPVVALDVPTGLDATMGAAAEGTVRAAVTVAFGAVKAGLVVGDGPQVAGRVVVVEIGVPEAELDAAAAAHGVTAAWVGKTLPRRAADAHKYSAGRVATVVGSRAFTGAAVLSSVAALRAGAGAVVCCTAAGAQAAVDAHSAEVMVEACPETRDGTLALTALDAITERLAASDAAVVGCGLGRASETDRLVRALVRRAALPVVLDADGLRAFAGHDAALAERAGGGPLVLTPHLGELRALVGDDRFSPADRIETVRGLAARWNAVLVLKGMPSVVGTPDGRVFVGPPGQPALATAGSGDILAGTIAGLMAQGLGAAEAAVCALHVGSDAARRAGGPTGAGVVASDLVAAIPAALAGYLA